MPGGVRVRSGWVQGAGLTLFKVGAGKIGPVEWSRSGRMLLPNKLTVHSLCRIMPPRPGAAPGVGVAARLHRFAVQRHSPAAWRDFRQSVACFRLSRHASAGGQVV